MTIIERIRKEFSRTTAVIAGFVNALRAVHAYNRALEDMEALKIKDPSNACKMSEASLIVSIQDDIGEINANMMKVNRSTVFLNNNKSKAIMLRNDLIFAQAHIAIALKHLDLLEAV